MYFFSILLSVGWKAIHRGGSPESEGMLRISVAFNKQGNTMDEGRERDKTSRGGGLPTLPGLYLSTIQPSQRGFF
jgi:hypothetical protein